MPQGFRRVGIVWAGRPTHNNDRNRSAMLADFAPLATLPGMALVALQKGPTTGQAGGYFGRAPLINIGAEIQDYDDTMALLECLDLLMTVDTSVGHLAGAMGMPVGSCCRARRIGAGCWSVGYPVVSDRAAVSSADRSPVG